MEEGVSQQASRGEAEQHLQQVLVLIRVGLDRDEEEDEEGGRTDQQSGADRLDNRGRRRVQRNNTKT